MCEALQASSKKFRCIRFELCIFCFLEGEAGGSVPSIEAIFARMLLLILGDQYEKQRKVESLQKLGNKSHQIESGRESESETTLQL